MSKLLAVLLIVMGSTSLEAQGTKATKDQAKRDQEAAAHQKAVTGSLGKIASEIEAIHKQTADIERSRADEHSQGWLKKAFAPERASDWALFIVGVAGIAVALVTLTKIERQITEAKRSAEAALKSADAAEATASSLQSAERAYVGIQYRQKGDADWQEDFSFYPCQRNSAPQKDGRTCYRLHVRITNSGRTPAEIIGGWIQCVPRLHAHTPGFQPSLSADDGRGKIHGNFLHAGGHYSEKLSYQLTPDDESAIAAKEMWLVGYVDYRTFDGLHRAGFCRRVGTGNNPAENNLFIDDHCEGRNDDRKLESHTN